MSRKSVGTMVGAALLISATAYGAFGNPALKGPYMLQVSGTTTDSAGEVGTLGLNGLIVFNGKGSVPAIDVNITAADQAGDVSNCNLTGSATAALSSYSVNPDGTGTLTIGMPTGSCLNSSGSTQTIEFGFVLSRNAVGISRLMTNGNFGALQDAFGQAITTMVLPGELQHQ